MVQIYQVGNENFENNGDAVLICFSCDLSVELNGTWVLNLEVPIDEDGRWKLVTENAVIKVPTWQSDEQLYRIASYTKTESGVSAVAYPIFYDAAKDAFLLDVRPTISTGQEALDHMMDGTPYSGKSDIATRSTAYFVRRNLLDCICGNNSPTFLERWGGEVLYDNYKIIVNERVGGDYGIEIRYGKNIIGTQYTVDMTDVITRIVPVSYYGHMISGDTPYVDSPNINAYPVVYTKEVVYDWIRMAKDVAGENSDDFVICSTQEELDAALQAAAEADFANGCDTPAITMDVDVKVILENKNTTNIAAENLTDTSEDVITDTTNEAIQTSYILDYARLEKVRLGDTVHCRHRKLNITSEARVVALTWDCLTQNVTHVTLGNYKYDYVKVMTNTVQRANKVLREDGTVIAEKVRGFLDGQNTMFRTQYDLAEKQDILSILFENLDTESPMYGALGIGTQGISVSKTRTADDRDWIWTTGLSANGINTEIGVFGILADRAGYNYFNLDTGESHIGNTTNYVHFDPDTGLLTINVAALEISGTSVAESLSGLSNDITDLSKEVSDAQTAASDAQTAAGDAAKTATNYLRYTAADGLVVKMDASTNTGYNTQIKSDGIYFRNGTSVLTSINGTAYTINQIGNTALPAMVLEGTGMSYYKTGTSTVSAKYTSNGLEVSYGNIGGFEIDTTSIHTTGVAVTSNADNSIALSSVDFARTINSTLRGGLRFAIGDKLGVAGDGKIYASDVELSGTIIAAEGTLGGFHITSTQNAGSSLLDGHIYPYSLYHHAGDGTDYEYEAGLKGDATENPSSSTTSHNNYVFYVGRIAKGADWDTKEMLFYVRNNGSVYCADLTATGNITATSGYIGNSTNGFTIGSTAIYNGTNSITSTRAGIYLGTDGIRQYQNANAHATITNGVLTTVGANIKGEIKATSGYIGSTTGFKINSTAIYNGTDSMTSNSNGIYLGTDGINLGGKFTVDKYGSANLYSATVYGTIISADYSSTSIDDAYITIAGDKITGEVNLDTVATIQFDYYNLQKTLILYSRGDIQLKCGNNGIIYLDDTVEMGSVSTDSSATKALYLDAMDRMVYKTSSSSIKYKDIQRPMDNADITSAYNIQPVIGKYKEGVLPETDLRYDKAFPMLIAEDVAKYIPDAVDYENGEIETWNERILIPVMFQMIKNLKKELEVLRSGSI